MDPLREWHRYVDSLSRPARRLVGEEALTEAPAWRPWTGSADQDADAAAPTMRPGQIPSLPIGAFSANAVPQEPESIPASFPEPQYRDLTVSDRLPPRREFDLPTFQVPSFELAAPLLTPGRSGSDAVEETPAAEILTEQAKTGARARVSEAGSDC